MNRFNLVIKNDDGSIYWSIGFQTKAEMNLWLELEKSKFYWKKEFTTEITDNSAAVDAAAKASKDAIEAAATAQRQKRDDARAAVTAFKAKPTKTVADLVSLLQVMISILDIDS